MTAILRRAILDFVVYREQAATASEKSEAYQLWADAAGWLFFDGEEEIDEGGLYTFRFICSMLEIEPQQLREAVLTMGREAIQRFNGRMSDV